MAEKNNFLLIVTVIILLVLVALVLNNLTGLVTSDVEAKLETNPNALTFSRYDNSHVVAVSVDSGSDKVGRNFVLKAAKNGEAVESGALCDDVTCEGKISKNFIINRNIESGDYYFEIDRICNDGHLECEALNPKIRSSILEIKHI